MRRRQVHRRVEGRYIVGSLSLQVPVRSHAVTKMAFLATRHDARKGRVQVYARGQRARRPLRFSKNVVSAHACCRVSHREPMSNNNPYCDACAALALLSSEQSVSGNAGNSRERAPTITAI